MLIRIATGNNPNLAKKSQEVFQRLVDEAITANPWPPIAEYILRRNKELREKKSFSKPLNWAFDADKPFRHPPL
ncbi:hypothetical protein QCA50_008499 [Cerrena zonata]|uniref:Uncharacterized protein n=1 Tax=Cerrena zonata TaxID=2478898 RepID=A0AAW0G9T0_9APHY